MEYTLRKLGADDLFVVANLVNKIGFNEIGGAFKTDKATQLKGKTVTDAEAQSVGMEVMFNIAGIVIKHLMDVKNDLYDFLSSVSNIDRNDINKLSMVELTELIIDVVKMPDFVDFIKVASKLFK